MQPERRKAVERSIVPYSKLPDLTAMMERWERECSGSSLDPGEIQAGTVLCIALDTSKMGTDWNYEATYEKLAEAIQRVSRGFDIIGLSHDTFHIVMRRSNPSGAAEGFKRIHATFKAIFPDALCIRLRTAYAKLEPPKSKDRQESLLAAFSSAYEQLAGQTERATV